VASCSYRSTVKPDETFLHQRDRLFSVEDYEPFIGPEIVDRILQKAKTFQAFRIVNFNSTFYGGGVAELLSGMTLLMNSVGIKAEWRVIQ
jgi:trehalose synthase